MLDDWLVEVDVRLLDELGELAELMDSVELGEELELLTDGELGLDQLEAVVVSWIELELDVKERSVLEELDPVVYDRNVLEELELEV